VDITLVSKIYIASFYIAKLILGGIGNGYDAFNVLCVYLMPKFDFLSSVICLIKFVYRLIGILIINLQGIMIHYNEQHSQYINKTHGVGFLTHYDIEWSVPFLSQYKICATSTDLMDLLCRKASPFNFHNCAELKTHSSR
jgi:hypothetical protein